METLLQDIRYSLRLFRKNPGFTILAVLTLALGIGANTAIFSATSGLFLRPLPVPKPDQLVRIGSIKPASDVEITSYPNYFYLRDHAQSFSDVAGHGRAAVSFSSGAASDTVNAEVVSGNFFQVYNLVPASGRLLSTADDQKEGAHPVIVISYRLWKNFFHGADVIGKKIYLNSHPFQIVGVAPQFFYGSYLTLDADLWGTIAMHEELRPRGIPLDTPGWGWLNITARLKDGVSRESAISELSQLALQLRREYPRENDGLKFELTQASLLPEGLSHQLQKILLFLSCIAALILLVVCANLAGALLPRIVARKRELAIRNSLGASATRLVRQWITESSTLCLLGGAGGVLVAFWCREGLKFLLPSEWQVLVTTLPMDLNVLAFAVFISFITGIFCGAVTAINFRKEKIQSGLKNETGGVPRHRLFGVFVSAQTSISLLLMIIAALLLRSLAGSSTFHLGFDEKNLLLASVDTRRHGYDEAKARKFFQQLSERIQQRTGVVAVSYATVTPLEDNRETQGYRIAGESEILALSNNSVGAGYFHAMRIPLMEGRDFSEQDLRENSIPVAIVNTTMAKKFWPNESPVGKRIGFGENGPDLQIIGVAKDIQYYSIGEKPMPYVYTTPGVVYTGQMTLQIRTAGKPESFIPMLLQEIKTLDAGVAPFQVQSFSSLRKVQLFPVRALATISLLIGCLGLILTGLGIYGVVAYAVAQRTKEIGLRMALGSPRKNILLMVLRQGMNYVAVGAAAGICAALATTRFLGAILFQVSPTDFLSFFGTSVLIFFSAILAVSLPTRKAMKIDPATALRYE